VAAETDEDERSKTKKKEVHRSDRERRRCVREIYFHLCHQQHRLIQIGIANP